MATVVREGSSPGAPTAYSVEVLEAIPAVTFAQRGRLVDQDGVPTELA